jgi:putative transposase
LVHAILSTKGRSPSLDPDVRTRLFPYMGGVLREIGAALLLINGPDDHVHLLTGLPATLAVAEAMRIVKSNSSKWIHEQWPGKADFAWQSGYGAFSVSQSNLEAVRRYIAEQEEHHKSMSFQEEFLAFLKRHGLAYDERFIWD